MKECTLCKCHYPEDIKYFPLEFTKQEIGGLCYKCDHILEIAGVKFDKHSGKRKDPWTTLEEEWLVKNYGKMKTSTIAKKLGRTQRAVYRRMELIRERGND